MFTKIWLPEKIWHNIELYSSLKTIGGTISFVNKPARAAAQNILLLNHMSHRDPEMVYVALYWAEHNHNLFTSWFEKFHLRRPQKNIYVIYGIYYALKLRSDSYSYISHKDASISHKGINTKFLAQCIDLMIDTKSLWFLFNKKQLKLYKLLYKYFWQVGREKKVKSLIDSVEWKTKDFEMLIVHVLCSFHGKLHHNAMKYYHKLKEKILVTIENLNTIWGNKTSEERLKIKTLLMSCIVTLETAVTSVISEKATKENIGDAPVNLQGMFMSIPNLEKKMFLRNADMLRACVVKLYKKKINDKNVDFGNTNLRGTDFEGGQFSNLNFSDVYDVRGATFLNSLFLNVNFSNVDLSEVRFHNVTFENVDCRGAILRKVEFYNCKALHKIKMNAATFINTIKATSEPCYRNGMSQERSKALKLIFEFYYILTVSEQLKFFYYMRNSIQDKKHCFGHNPQMQYKNIKYFVELCTKGLIKTKKKGPSLKKKIDLVCFILKAGWAVKLCQGEGDTNLNKLISKDTKTEKDFWDDMLVKYREILSIIPCIHDEARDLFADSLVLFYAKKNMSAKKFLESVLKSGYELWFKNFINMKKKLLRYMKLRMLELHVSGEKQKALYTKYYHLFLLLRAIYPSIKATKKPND